MNSLLSIQRHLWMVSFVAVILSGCGSARYVFKDSDLGVVAMPSNSERNREKALELMQQHFPDGYEIDREEETVVGLVTHEHVHGDANRDKTKHGEVQFASATSTATTTDKTEYRISYRRR
ncbi:hypothetical protein Poly51_47280 [Rubripirellula tenax]|uniref:Lipoprotein n=1 Tax=Rubripirellula tenax TaxID=2528015 RepID=A0A5C6EJU6_9BACT|nr:hypothetical protein [Rubripirellula tenax]TWU48824.1 hypothetical protein Poly51_47280 [Rubripirellula tenax]